MLAAFALFAISTHAREAEFRGFWADGYHPGYMTSAEVTNLVADLRRAHFNAVIAEVRKRADAHYHSDLEPKAPGIEPSYDPLADLITQAHHTNNGSFSTIQWNEWSK